MKYLREADEGSSIIACVVVGSFKGYRFEFTPFLLEILSTIISIRYREETLQIKMLISVDPSSDTSRCTKYHLSAL